MNTTFQLLVILGFVALCCALLLLVKGLSIINENLEYILKELYILIKDK